MNIMKITTACLFGLCLTACGTDDAKPADADPLKESVPAKAAANLATTKLELSKVP